jgi:hypothetical protein
MIVLSGVEEEKKGKLLGAHVGAVTQKVGFPFFFYDQPAFSIWSGSGMRNSGK